MAERLAPRKMQTDNMDMKKGMADMADGAIVGSEIIKLLEKYGREAPAYVGEHVKSMKEDICPPVSESF